MASYEYMCVCSAYGLSSGTSEPQTDNCVKPLTAFLSLHWHLYNFRSIYTATALNTHTHHSAPGAYSPQSRTHKMLLHLTTHKLYNYDSKMASIWKKNQLLLHSFHFNPSFTPPTMLNVSHCFCCCCSLWPMLPSVVSSSLSSFVPSNTLFKSLVIRLHLYLFRIQACCNLKHVR